MSSMLLYQNIAPLSPEQFKNRTYARMDDFSFAAATGSIPIAGIEFVEAAKEFPVVFFKNRDNEYIPAVILGPQEQQNHVVSKEGVWKAFFIPAYLHRYPFLSLADEKENTLNYCIDDTYPGLDSEGGAPLFLESGKPAPILDEAMKLMQAYHHHMLHTMDFSRRLAECGLLEEKELQAQVKVNDTDTGFTISGIHIVNEKRLLALAEEQVLDFFRKGEMAWIYCHLISLSNFPRMLSSFPPEPDQG